MSKKSSGKNVTTTIKENPGKEEPLWKGILTLEPGLVIHMTAVMMVIMVIQDFLLEKACRVNLGYSDQVCDALALKQSDKYDKEEKAVQTLIGSVLMTKTLIENLFPILLVFLIGAWSDKYGRKLPLLFVIVAYFIQNLLLILCAYFSSTGAWSVAIVSSLIASLSGNQACFMVAVFSYVSDTTAVEKRTERTGITSMCIFLGVILGMGGGGMLSKMDLVSKFAICVGLEATAFLYLVLMMKNKGQPGVTEGKTQGQIFMELFDFQHVKDAKDTVLKTREGNTRTKLWLLLIAHSCVLMPMFGEMSVGYLSCRLMFNWDGGDFGTFMTYKMFLGLVANFVSMGILTKMFKLSDPTNGIIACLSNLVAALMFAFATSPTMYYIAPLASLLSGSAMVIPRATISKLIPTSELGKVNSFIGSLESILPLVASSMYTSVYTKYMDVLPGSFYLISGAVMVPPILIYFWFMHNQHQPTDKKQD